MTVNKTTTKYLKLIEDGLLTEGQIISLRTFLKNNPSERGTLLSALRRKPIEITAEQTEKGIAYLRNAITSPTGKRRQSNSFSDRQVRIINNFKKFQLVDMDMLTNGFWTIYYPVYRVIAKNGNSFDYSYQLHDRKFVFHHPAGLAF